MKIQTFFILIVILVFLNCSKQTYFSKAENEINEIIEKNLVCKNEFIYDELQKCFENFFRKNGFVNDKEAIEHGYFNYLNSILIRGSELDLKKNNLETKELIEKINCSGYNLGFEKDINLLKEWFTPTINKYKSELIEEKKTSEFIYIIGTSDLKDRLNTPASLNDFLNSYNRSDFKRPILKIIILAWFVPYELRK